MRALKRRDELVERSEPILDTDLADECEAFLDGRLVHVLQARRLVELVGRTLYR